MSQISDLLCRSPELFPQGLDLETDSLRLLRLSETDYAKASFLDDRLLTAGTPTRPLPFGDAQAAATEGKLPEACHFIFHISHVGSTLLSRLLGRHGGVLSIREPMPLRLLAQMRAEPDLLPRSWSEAAFEDHLSTLLKLWSRTFRPDQIAVVKASSFASELAADILRRAYQPKAIFMFVPPEVFLATILGAANSQKDMQVLGPMRLKRLQRALGEPPQNPATMGELVAMSWASEMASLMAALPASRDRILWLDFDRFLADPHTALSACFNHLAAGPSDGEIAAILSGPDMLRYSKAQEYDYDAKLRSDVLAQARAMHDAEIRRGLEWLEKISARHSLIEGAVTLSGAS